MSPNKSWLTRIVDEATALGPDLVSAWISLSTSDGRSLVGVAAALSTQSGHSYDSNRLLKWRRGEERVPLPAEQIMRRDLLAYLLGDDAGNVIAAVLTPPQRGG